MLQTQIKKTYSVRILLWLACLLLMFVGLFPVTARAETSVEEEKSMAQQVMDSSVFITFKKEDTAGGKGISYCVYVPKEVYNNAATYGLLVGSVSDLNSINSKDYLREFDEAGIEVTNLSMLTPYETEEGYILENGLTDIGDEELELQMFYIFYVTDFEDNTAYMKPKIGSYTNISGKAYTEQEIMELLEQKLSLKTTGETMIEKLSELVDAFWIYIVMACGVVVVVWGGYIGIRIIIANRKDEKIAARDMVKHLFIGILVMFVIAGVMPLLIKGLNAWL